MGAFSGVVLPLVGVKRDSLPVPSVGAVPPLGFVDVPKCLCGPLRQPRKVAGFFVFPSMPKVVPFNPQSPLLYDLDAEIKPLPSFGFMAVGASPEVFASACSWLCAYNHAQQAAGMAIQARCFSSDPWRSAYLGALPKALGKAVGSLKPLNVAALVWRCTPWDLAGRLCGMTVPMTGKPGSLPVAAAFGFRRSVLDGFCYDAAAALVSGNGGAVDVFGLGDVLPGYVRLVKDCDNLRSRLRDDFTADDLADVEAFLSHVIPGLGAPATVCRRKGRRSAWSDAALRFVGDCVFAVEDRGLKGAALANAAWRYGCDLLKDKRSKWRRWPDVAQLVKADLFKSCLRAWRDKNRRG